MDPDIERGMARGEDRAEAHADRELLRVISDVQSRFIAGSDTSELFDCLLADLLRLTASEYGFISEVLFEVDGTPYLETRDLTDTTWSDTTRQRFRSLYRFFNRVVASRAPLISNDPARDLRTNRFSPGRPGLQAFLGLPLVRGGTLLGVAGIVNRPGGYDQALVAYLEPFLATCANLIEAHRADLERRESEQARHDGEARIRAIVETALDGILALDEHGRIDHVNPAVERMFARPASALVNAHVSVLIPAFGLAGRSAAGSGSCLSVGAAVLGPTREVVALRADGTTFPLEVAFSAMQIGGRQMYTGILRDISERKKIDRLKSEFVSTVSHELRTPLTSIRGALGLLAGGIAGSLPPQALAMITIALNNGERLGRLIDDILDIEKIESGRLDFHPCSVRLGAVVRRSLEANQGYADAHQIRLVLVGDVPPTAIVADEDRVTQVLANLISNAIKFSPPGAAVEVRVVEVDKRLRVSVTDCGPGIPDEFKPRIFQRFAQADGSDARQKGGTGLGLSIAKAIVDRMDGRIGFEPHAPTGTTFFFELPVEPSESQNLVTPTS